MREFPIVGTWDRKRHVSVPYSSIPWDMIQPHENQALKNHCGQTLERLAQRGGLSHCEAVAILEDRDWKLMDLDDAISRLKELTENFLKQEPITQKTP